MDAIDDFSRLIAGIYSAVMTPEQWDVTMADIGRPSMGPGRQRWSSPTRTPGCSNTPTFPPTRRRVTQSTIPG